MYQYSGQCSCSEVDIKFSSPHEISRYQSRRCDCDYCMQRGIEYLSDPQGHITLISRAPLQHEIQGSEQATFLLCAHCQTVVAVAYFEQGGAVGSVNARLLGDFEKVQGCIVVSPKTLDKTEKVKRWRELWSQMLVKVI